MAIEALKVLDASFYLCFKSLLVAHVILLKVLATHHFLLPHWVAIYAHLTSVKDRGRLPCEFLFQFHALSIKL
jgi:hypothetical protein